MTRNAIRLVWLAAMFGALATSAAAAEAVTAPSADPFTLKELSPGVWAAIDREGKSGANAGFIIGDDGVAVVDSFYNPDAARALLADIRKMTPLPIRYVINTHYHIDHVSGDEVFRQAGALVVAQRNVHGWMRTENLKFFGADPKPEQRAMVGGLALPDIGVERELTLWLGKRRLELKAWPGHTGGDLMVKAPDAKVVFCGDLLWRRTAPNLIDATVAKWLETLSSLQRGPQAAETTFVPGHGQVANVADVADFRGYLKDVRSTVAARLKAGAKGDELVKSSVADLSVKYGTWDYFARGAPREVGFMAAELGGTKRTPPQTAPEPW
jgi:glyoxylase-like metal-dependent hydrolase (beta-lactamase superfamily II)